MRNPYIEAQLLTMEMTIRNCVASCHNAATQDDGVVTSDEARVPKKLDQLTARFLQDLSKLT